MAMNKYQLQYAKAKADYITRNQRREKLGRPYWNQWEKGKLDVDELINKEAEIDKKVGHTKSLDKLIKAESDLIRWARDDIKAKYPARYEQIKEVFEKIKLHPHLKNKLVDISMRYRPTPTTGRKASRTPRPKSVRITPKRPRIS